MSVKGVSFKKYREEGCRYEVALPKEMTGNNVICYIHDGGFVSGSASSSRGYSSMLAVTSGLRLIKSMKKWGQTYPHAGYGARFISWVLSADSELYGSYGNGSGMRVSPAGWLYDTTRGSEDFESYFNVMYGGLLHRILICS